jgi:YtxH-like protein
MRNRRNDILRILLGAGLYMLDPVRNVLADRIEDFTDRFQDTYEDVTDRASRVSRTLRGRDHGSRYPAMDSGISLLLGVGIGVGVGMLLAPASGKQTRTHLAGRAHDVGDKVHSFGDRVKERFSPESKPITASYGGV